MGTWGTGILDDDFARDVYDQYIDACGKGQSGTAIIKALRKEFARSIADPDEGPLFWLAVAHAQWDCSSVTPDVRKHVEDIVAKGLGLARWEDEGRTELAQRKSALSRFLAKIQKLRRGKPRRPAVPAAIPFAVGDCLAIDIGDGEFGAAVVTKHFPGSSSSHILSVVDFRETSPPGVELFRRPSWLTVTQTPEQTIVKYQVYADGYRRHQARYQMLDRIDLADVPPPLTLRLANWGNVWKDLGDRLRRHAPGIL